MPSLALLLAVGSAHAAPVAWQWGGEPVRYHLETKIKMQSPVRFLARQNLDARPTRLDLALDISCQARDGKKGWLATCDLDHVRLHGAAWPGEQEKLDTILVEWSQDLENATMQLQVLPDGRIAQVDLEGVGKKDDREKEIQEIERQLLRRAVTPLDLQVLGVEPVVGKSWKQKGHPLAMEMISKYGTAGGMLIKNEVASVDGATVRVQTEGRGNVSKGTNLDQGTGALVNMIVTGDGLFDTTTGRLLFREVHTQGELNQSTGSAEDADFWLLDAWAGRINEDGTVEGGAAD